MRHKTATKYPGLTYLKNNWIIKLTGPGSGTILHRTKDLKYNFTVNNKQILSDPPASSLPRGLRHFLEDLCTKN